jgi:hypothetical protein
VPTRFIAENVWREITAATKKKRGRAFVAVPYFGEAGSRLLPLRKGDTLLVNASDAAVKSGQTHPQALRRLLNKGVKLYTLGTLHAKIYVFGATAFIGSANASASSRDELKEAVVRVRDPSVVAAARRYIHRLCTAPIQGRHLQRLARIYRPPRQSGEGKRNAESGRRVKPRVFLAQVTEGEIAPEYQEALDKGEREARARREDRTSTIESIWWHRKFPYEMDDTVIRVFKTRNNATYVCPPATVVNRKVVPQGKCPMWIVYLETPTRPWKRIKTVKNRLPKSERERIDEDRRLPDDEFRARLFEIVG